MTRKSVKFASGLRRGPWKTSLSKQGSDEKSDSFSIRVGAVYTRRWSNLKSKFQFRTDSELVDYLLTLGETQPKPSISPNHESDDGWCVANASGRRKRGPSLRAVLRRSTRNTGSKSESIESEDLHTEDSCLSLEDVEQSGKLSGNHPRSSKFSDYNDILLKKTFHTASESQKESTSDDEREAKANQLNAELALLVESVALKPQERNEHELYEFREDLPPENGFQPHNSSSQTKNNSIISKSGHKRWKSYHKDKRKWKQSYAAIDQEDKNVTNQMIKMKTKEECSTSSKSEMDKKIFKTLKKNRILTAYLDSQNKIGLNNTKDSCCPNKEDVEAAVKEEDDKPETQEQSPSNHKTLEKVDAENETDKGQENEKEPQAVEKEENILSGKENQSKTASAEPVFIEVGERVKLKRRRKKLHHDSEEPLSRPKEDNSITADDLNTTDQETTLRRQRRNWKKFIINHELEESELRKRNRTFSESSTNSCQIPCDTLVSESQTESEPTYCDHKPTEVAVAPIKTSTRDSHSALPESQENDKHNMENCSVNVQNCSHCNLRHNEQPCPVQYPLHTVVDSITFEQWQLQCQVQVRCSVIEAPRPKSARLKKSNQESQLLTDLEKKTRDSVIGKIDSENTRSYAEECLPSGLELRVVNEVHGKSVIALNPISQYTQFGPLVGPRIHEKDISDESDMRYIWEILDGKQAVYINTEDPQKSNWLRFIRPAPEREERNITLMVKNKQLYFVSIVEIPQGNELLYWADDHITLWSKKKILKSTCGGCNMRFAHPLYYRTHCAVFHDPLHSLTIRKYHCKVCGEAVMGKENIMKHAADLHEGRGAYQCQYCHKFFLRLNYLEMHRTYGCSSNPHRTRPLCDFCGRYFCQPQKLKVHIKRMHSDLSDVLREFQCKSCLKILGSRAALQRHFKEVHHRDVVVTSSCDRCGKSFQNRSNLKIHMLTHSGVKPFRCQQGGCSAAFTTKQCLQFHYKKAHGLSEESLPRIERSIAYTFDAYAGETADGSNKITDHSKKPQPFERKGRKSSKSSKNRNNQPQNLGMEDQREVIDPPVNLPTETRSYEPPSILVECSDPLQVSHSAEQQCCTSVPDHSPISEPVRSQKFMEADTSCGSSLQASGIISSPYCEEDKHSEGEKTLTPLQTVTLQHHLEEEYHRSQHVNLMMSCHSPSQSPLSPQNISPSQDLRSIISLESKGHKKWLGEVIEVAEEAAAAAMQLSPRLSPRPKRDLYDFDEHSLKSKLQYVDNAVRQDLQVDMGMGRSKTASALAPFHPPESASMLVEAALDAAERDICCPSLTSKTSPVVSSNSPEPLHLSHPTYCSRSPPCGDMSSPPYYASDPAAVPTSESSISHFSLSHSPGSHPHIHPLDVYSTTSQIMSPSRLYNVNVHHHQLHQHQLSVQGPPSSDEEGGVDSDYNSRGECAQNLSLNVKDKTSSHSDVSTMYNVSTHSSELVSRSPAYQEHVPLSQQNDLNFSGAMVIASPRYHLYDLSTDRQRSEMSVTDLTVSNRNSAHDYGSHDHVGGSVDLSLPRSHSASDGHIMLSTSPTSFNSNQAPPNLAHLSPSQHGHPGPAHQYGSPHAMSSYSSHPVAYQNTPLQRCHITSSSNSPTASASPGPAHYHSYPPYY